MSYLIYISKSINFSLFYKYFDDIFNILNKKYKYIENYDDKVDFIIKSKNDLDEKTLEKCKRNITIINCLQNNHLMMNKKIFLNFKYTPYFFYINFDNMKYDKKIVKNYIEKYKRDDIFGDKYWILKNTKSGKAIGTMIVRTEELYNLENNKEFIKERNNFGEKTEYIIQKYLEKPILYNNLKYDLRVYILILSSLDNDNNIYYKFYLFNEILIKFSTKKYDLKDKNKKTHITNMHLHGIVNFNDLKNIVTKDKFDYIYNDIFKNVKKFIKFKLFHNLLHKINNYPYVFDIIGLDVLVDEKYNTYLIDFNINPGYNITMVNKEELDKIKIIHDIHDNLLYTIFIKIIKKYNKIKKFIDDKNYNNFKNFSKEYKFKKYFKFITNSKYQVQ